MTRHGLSLAERMALYYVKGRKNECWLWTGNVQRGYGYITIKNRSQRVHRVMFELTKGKIKKGLEVRHSCDIKNCVNPDHLLLGTHADNMRDASERKRFPDRRGSKGTRAKLHERDIPIIRADSRGMNTVAKEYGVNKTLIWMIRKRKIWKHV